MASFMLIVAVTVILSVFCTDNGVTFLRHPNAGKSGLPTSEVYKTYMLGATVAPTIEFFKA